MFTVNAYSHFGNSFERTYINFDYALTIFNIACKCEDCSTVDIIDATTGELILAWNSLRQELITGYDFAKTF